MVATTLDGVLLTGNHASRPAATDVSKGTLYSCTTHSLVYQSDAASWSTWATLGSGTPGLILLEQHSASSSSSLDFTTFISSTYDTYRIIGTELIVATNTANLLMEVGTGAGPTYDTGNNYEWSGGQGTTGGTGIVAPDFASTGIMRIFATMANAAGYGFGSFDIMAMGLQSTSIRKTFFGTQHYVTSTGPKAILGAWAGQWTTTATAATALRFIASSGNITSGTIRIYGVAK